MQLHQLMLLLLNFNLGICESTEKWKSYSTSVIAMTNLLEIEHFLARTIEENYFRLGTQSNIVSSFVEKLYEEHKNSFEDFEAFLSNPLNSFALIRRMFEDWPIILNYLDEPFKPYVEKGLAMNEIQLPTSEDMMEAVIGIERIRRTYKLYPADIAQGRLNGIKYDGRLISADLFMIGYQLFRIKRYKEAAAWLKVALDTDYQVIIPSEISNFDRESIELLYLNTIKQKVEAVYALDSDIYLESGCRDKEMNSISNLSCLYNSTSNPFYVLSPFKMEQLSKDPYVVMFHDVLTNEEMQQIKNDARYSLRRAGILSDTNRNARDFRRTTHYAVIALEDVIMRKILDITGLDIKGFEPIKVINYGLGGHYVTHQDFIYPLKDHILEEMGDRIASILIYLSDVEQGGATIFPYIGLSVKPKKGSLLLWYNFKNNGTPDLNTAHGACPIIFGSKWAATIWVRERAQFRTMPCYNP